MEIRDKFYEMLELQLVLNNETNGLEWTKGYNKNNKLIDWNRCIYMESAELIDSFSWKHWKNINSATDWDNVYIELVDIWHFILSLKLESNQNNIVNTDELSKNEFTKLKNLKAQENIYDILEITRELINNTSSQNSDLNKTIEIYFRLCTSCGMSFDNIYDLYIGKNVLNKFRQDNGYKTGKYIKIWNGKEDNQIMMQIMQSLEKINFNILYNELEVEYKKVS